MTQAAAGPVNLPPLLALRTLKSETVAGLSEETCKRLQVGVLVIFQVEISNSSDCII